VVGERVMGTSGSLRAVLGSGCGGGSDSMIAVASDVSVTVAVTVGGEMRAGGVVSFDAVVDSEAESIGAST
jgi:hypothetical protein